MSEIVARLRRLVGQEGIGPVALALLARDAADLIERTQSLADEWHDEWQKSNARLAEVDAALAAWGRNEAGDAATIVRIAKAVGLPDSADVTCATHGCTFKDGKCVRCWRREPTITPTDQPSDAIPPAPPYPPPRDVTGRTPPPPPPKARR